MRRTIDGRDIYFPDFNGKSSTLSEDEGMDKDRYELWLESERQKGPISHIFHWINDDRNEPIIDIDD
jgi:hypothetical protein